MENYLGSKTIPIEETPFADDTPTDWVMRYIIAYGGFCGEHHKTWVIDQIARILKGTPMIVQLAQWGKSETEVSHSEWRYYTGDPSPEYLDMVAHACYDEETDDPNAYFWDVGIAP